MKIKDGYIIREVAGSNIVVPIGDEQMSFGGIMTLNPVGAFIWKLLEKGATKDELVDAVLKEYEIDRDTASSDIDKYIAKLREKNVIED